jgi:hypothetical protein
VVVFFFKYRMNNFMCDQNNTLEAINPINLNVAASLPVTNKSGDADFTKLAVRRFVVLVITDSLGCVRGSICGETGPGGALAIHLRDAFEEDCAQVHKIDDSLTPLGQDLYEVERAFVMESLSLMWNWENAQVLRTVIPQDSRFTFIVNY